MESKQHDILTLQELAELLRVSRTTAYRLVESRAISFHKIGRHLRFRRPDVEAFIQQHRFESRGAWL